MAYGPRRINRYGKIDEALGRIETFLHLRNRCDRKERDYLYQSFQTLADFASRVEKARVTGNVDYDTWEADLLAVPRDHRWLKQGFGPYSSVHRRATRICVGGTASSYRRRPAGNRCGFRRRSAQRIVAGGRSLRSGESASRAIGLFGSSAVSRRLLDNEAARDYFRARYPYVFIDEFQDTDPVQAEVLSRIWTHPVIAGDRKQSIYRFRRADVRQYEDVCKTLTERGAATEQLTNCSRNTTPIQDFVNFSFAGMTGYLPLGGGREPKAGQPNIIALPMPKPYGTRNLSKARINECSPSTVAAFIEWLVNKSGYQVWDQRGESIPQRASRRRLHSLPPLLQ